MPANLSPEYRKAEQAFRAARDPGQRLTCLKEMLRTIPRHKGTEHIQADIKSRIRELTDQLAGPRKGPTRSGPSHAVRREGAAQVCLIGPPNSGKSALHATLTGSKAQVAPFPWTTHDALPGMLPCEDIAFQLVDLPPIAPDRMESWMAPLLEGADAAWLVVDLADPACAEHVPAICTVLAQHKVHLSDRWPGLDRAQGPAPRPDAHGADPGGSDESAPDPFRIELPTLLVANKSDLDPEPGEVQVLEELTGVCFPAVSVSATTGRNLTKLAPFLRRALDVVRVYTKLPGHPVDRDRPFALRHGDTVLDVARMVHQDVGRTLRFARLWGSATFDGQQVGPDHVLADGDVVELHGH